MDQETKARFDEMYDMLKEMHQIVQQNKQAAAMLKPTDAELHTSAVESIIIIIASAYPKWVAYSAILRKVYKKLKFRVPEFVQIITELKDRKIIEETSIGGGAFYRTFGNITNKDDAVIKSREPKPKFTSTTGAWEAAGFGSRKADPTDYNSPRIPDSHNVIKSATGEDVDLDGVIDLTR